MQTWHVVVQSRQRLDLSGAVGTSSQVDLVVRGDRFARRVKAYSGPISLGSDLGIYFQPSGAFQLVPGAFNRVLAGYQFKSVGSQ